MGASVPAIAPAGDTAECPTPMSLKQQKAENELPIKELEYGRKRDSQNRKLNSISYWAPQVLGQSSLSLLLHLLGPGME